MLGNPNFLLFIIVAGGRRTDAVLLPGSGPVHAGRGHFQQDVPASMALAQVAQAVATFFLLGMFLTRFGFKWTLAIGAACWLVMYLVYVVGKPQG